MAGKFINTTRTDTINTLVDNVKDIIKNPYYPWSDRQPTIVTYYNINQEMSTLDEGFKNLESDIGANSPLWYNKVENFFLYGLEQIQIQIDTGDFGTQASDITGEAYILPNTVIPISGDYFTINHIEENFLFRVTGMTHDTLENGSNAYKITYKLETISEGENKDFNIKDDYSFIVNNVGTKFNSVLSNKKIDLIKALEEFLYKLRTYYIDTFYNNRVQTFTYNFRCDKFYDPYMIQFMIDNDIMSGGDEYIYITHQTPLKGYFSIEYDKSFFSCLCKRDFKRVRKYNNTAISKYIDSIYTTIFGSRPEDYLEVDFRYNDELASLYGILPCFSEDLIDHIVSGELFSDENSIYNIIIKYAHNIEITYNDIDLLDFDIHNNIKVFYTVPCIIYCVERYIKRMMIDNTPETSM